VCCAILYAIPAQSPREGLLLFSQKVIKRLVGKRLLTHRAIPHKRSEHTGRDILPRSRYAQAQPFCKISNAFPSTHGHYCSARFWPKLFANYKRKKNYLTERTHYYLNITSSQAALAMLRQLQVLPNHCRFIATGPGCDFFFGSFLFERKRNEHPQTSQYHPTLPNEKRIGKMFIHVVVIGLPGYFCQIPVKKMTFKYLKVAHQR